MLRRKTDAASLPQHSDRVVAPSIFDQMLRSKKSVLRKERFSQLKTDTFNFLMPNPETAELILRRVLVTLEGEGFFIYRLWTQQNGNEVWLPVLQVITVLE